MKLAELGVTLDWARLSEYLGESSSRSLFL